MVIKTRPDNYIKIGKVVRPDTRRRIPLPKELVEDGISFQAWVNSEGQILLEPRVTIPASESWVFNNKDILALVQRGLSEAAEGKVSRVDLNAL